MPGAQRLECGLRGVWGWQEWGVKTVRRVGREGLSSWWALSTPHHTHGQEHFGYWRHLAEQCAGNPSVHREVHDVEGFECHLRAERGGVLPQGS